MQCVEDYRCQGDIWPAAGMHVEVDDTFRAKEPLPTCRHCGGLARPNVLMFGDFSWVSDRTDQQHARFMDLYDATLGPARKLVIVEIGAGEAVPTVRRFGENLVHREQNATLVRINPRDPGRKSDKVIPIQLGALEGLSQINHLIEGN